MTLSAASRATEKPAPTWIQPVCGKRLFAASMLQCAGISRTETACISAQVQFRRNEVLNIPDERALICAGNRLVAVVPPSFTTIH